MTDRIHLTLPREAAEGLALGTVVKVTLRGSISELREGYAENQSPAPIEVCVEGQAEVQPATFQDAANAAVARISNAKRPVDLPTYRGQQELHA